MTENHPAGASAVSTQLHGIAPGPGSADAAQARRAPKQSGTTRFYRPGLDALRFFAFAAVFLHHGVETLAAPGTRTGDLVQSLGFGLCLFFTLSAYLITTLLLRERAITGTISLKLFYERRILRIWPLYFFGLALGVVIDRHLGLFPANRSFYVGALLMVGNWFAPQSAYMLQLWSISVEEQFYLFWPNLVERATHPQLYGLGAALIAVSAAVTAWHGHRHADNTLHVWFTSLVQMQMFGAGILLALWQDRHPPVLRSLAARGAAVVVTPVIWFGAAHSLHIKTGFAEGAVPETLGYLLVGVTCALLVDALSSAQRVPRGLIALGRISFGLYVFHSPALLLNRHHFPAWHLHTLLPVAGMETLVAAALSYRYLEMPFLRLKAKLEVVKSRPLSASPL